MNDFKTYLGFMPNYKQMKLHNSKLISHLHFKTNTKWGLNARVPFNSEPNSTISHAKCITYSCGEERDIQIYEARTDPFAKL